MADGQHVNISGTPDFSHFCYVSVKCLLKNLHAYTVIQGIPNHWEFRVSPRNLLKKLKQSMHFVNLNFVL